MAKQQKTLVSVDLAKLSLGDMEDFEEYCGTSMMDLVENDEIRLTGKRLTALLWIALRKNDPEITTDQIREMTFEELEIDITDSSVEDKSAPLESGGKSAKGRSK